MVNIKQSQLDKMRKVSLEELSSTSNHMRNYFVYIGEDFATHFESVHIGFSSNNHLETIRELIKNQPIYKVLLDTRKFK